MIGLALASSGLFWKDLQEAPWERTRKGTKGAVGENPFRFAHFGHAIKNGPLSLAGETKGRLFEYIGTI